jgi:cobalt-zinc-cadmium efflux system membrane fusion protein
VAIRRNLLSIGAFVALIALFAFAANDFRLPGASSRPAGERWCEAHDVPLARCERCDPSLARGGTVVTVVGQEEEGVCPNTRRQIALAAGAAQEAGLEVVDAVEQAVEERLQANAETAFLPGGYARVAPRLSGVVVRIHAAPGRTVSAGETLVELESPELGRTKGDLVLAERAHARQKVLFEKNIATERELLEAETELARARQRLAVLGFSEAQIRETIEKRDVSPTLQLAAPFDGTVVHAWAVPGETAGPDKPLFGVADLERLWLRIDVYERDLPRVSAGQRVAFFVDGIPGTRFPGAVAAVGAEVDDRARTIPVYAEIKNVRGLLRANMFGRAEIRVREAEPKLLVPREAVQNDGDCDLVFVQTGANVFQARKVELGTSYGAGFEVTGGLRPGERVVGRGSFLLKTEVLRGQIGAG